MKKKILLRDKEFEYKLRKSRRAKRMRMTVYCGGDFVVTIPQNFQENLAEKFIREQAEWVFGKINYFRTFKKGIFSKSGKREYLKKKNEALEFVRGRIEHFREFYEFEYNKINIKNQKTRWGSCSKKGNLNFNYRIIHLPKRMSDYIIAHEICHLKEFNHSKSFWRLVGESVPDYRGIIKELKKL